MSVRKIANVCYKKNLLRKVITYTGVETYTKHIHVFLCALLVRCHVSQATITESIEISGLYELVTNIRINLKCVGVNTFVIERIANTQSNIPVFIQRITNFRLNLELCYRTLCTINF